MRLILTLICVIAICCSSYSQDIKAELQNHTKAQIYSYAFVVIEGKRFSKKLQVDVDLGDTPEQIKAGREYSEILTNQKSYTAVLNYMAEKEFELVESRDLSFSYQGTGGTSGIFFIMRKKQK